jgi:hypothetical protein
VGKLAGLWVDILAHDKTGIGLAAANGKLMAFGDKARRMLNIPLTIAGGLASGAVALGITKTARLASDLNETLSKVGVTFGESSQQVIAEADRMSDRFGIVRATFLDAASAFGLILQGAGLAAAESARLSTQLAKLAVDASSFYNVPIDVALEKIRAGLSGEAEPLRAFGVLLSEAAVKSKVAAMGLGEVTEASKGIARAQLIMEGLEKATGDLERTSGGYANQMRKMQGAITEFGASIGALTVGPLTAMVGTMNTLLAVVQDTFDPSRPNAFKAGVPSTADTRNPQGIGWWGRMRRSAEVGLYDNPLFIGQSFTRERSARLREELTQSYGAVGSGPTRPRETRPRPMENGSEGWEARQGQGELRMLQRMATNGLNMGSNMFMGSGDSQLQTWRGYIDKAQDGMASARDRIKSMEQSRSDRLGRGGFVGDQVSALRNMQDQALNDLPRQQLDTAKKQLDTLEKIEKKLRSGGRDYKELEAVLAE